MSHEPVLPPFHLTDPRQQHIFQRLGLIGPGAAAFYLDACRLMATQPPLEATTHLVSHLLREIESSLRAVLDRVAERVAQQRGAGRSRSNSQGHETQIRSILQALDIPESDPIAQSWLSLAGSSNAYALHARAHRDTLAAPRALDQEFHRFWEETQALLDVVLDRFEARYLDVHQLIDDLLSRASPSRDDVKHLRNQIPNNLVSLSYFFDSLTSPAWLGPLMEEGFFQNPPAPIVDYQEGTVRYPPWPAMHYLIRMAPQAPDTVRDIILSVSDTTNARVLADLLDAALALPAEQIISLLPRIERWFTAPHHFFGPERVTSLLDVVIQQGSPESALQLMRVLLSLRPDPQASTAQEGVGFFYRRLRPQPLLDQWTFSQAIQFAFPRLVPVAGMSALALLVDVLEEAMRLSRAPGDQEDDSYIWRRAIEDHEQDDPTDLQDTNEVLVSAVRDLAMALMPTQGVDVLHVLDGRSYSVFRRISLHLRRLWPDIAPEETAGLITDQQVLHDREVHHELYLLIQATFPRLPPFAQQAYLELVAQGPQLRRSADDEAESPRQQAEIAQFVRHWQYLWLLPIQEHLNEEWKHRFLTMQEEFGPQEHPEFRFYISTGDGMFDEVEAVPDLSGFSIDELVTYLSTQHPGEDIPGLPRGLVNKLEQAVAAAPKHFADHAERFQGLDPSFVNALLQALHKAATDKVVFSWAPVLRLCRWVTQQAPVQSHRTEAVADRDYYRSWRFRLVAYLIKDGLQGGPQEIPFELRMLIWDVIEQLTDDIDPEPAYEVAAKDDFLTLAINSVRGVAIQSALAYGLWVHRHLKRSQDDVAPGEQGFDAMAEVRRVLMRHLDTGREPSLAIRSVYGEWLPYLILLDRAWVHQHLGRIFPVEPDQQQFRNAAWVGYITSNPVYKDASAILEGEYGAAIERLGEGDVRLVGYIDPRRRLAEHLMIMYWRGSVQIDTQEGLLGRFFALAPADLREYAVSFLGRSAAQADSPLDLDIVQRLYAFWGWRLAVAKTSETPEHYAPEMAAFGQWFLATQLDNTWALTKLHEVLTIGGAVKHQRHIVKRLADLSAAAPLLVVRCLSLLLNVPEHAWSIDSWTPEIRVALRNVLQSDDPVTREEARALINRLGARGFLVYRDLLQIGN